MKLAHKIIFANTLRVIAIILAAAISYHEFDILLTRLHFTQIPNTLNESFLEMRLLEKNYFLYKDDTALPRIKKDIQKSYPIIDGIKPNIIKVMGDKNFEKLQLSLRRYEEAIEKMEKAVNNRRNIEELRKNVREAGRTLRLCSEQMIMLERQEVNDIVSASKKALLLSFLGLIFFIAILSSYMFFSRMFRNLKRIERTADSISEGNFKKIEGKIPKNELGSAMTAINKMCEELKIDNERLIQSRKLASLGTLTAGVAHELGNPLNNISMVAQTYLELYNHLSDEDRVDYVKKVLDESERIRRIVHDLLDFSRTKESDFRIFDINDLMRSSLKLVQNMLDVSGITTKLNLQDKLPPVFIDENKIREVLVNLITNSIHSMSAGDTIFLRTNLAEDKNHIIMEIEDTGKGIPPEFLTHIFDPFFSTKGTEGTGLGLSISYGIIKKHKGTINVKSTVGVGSTFTIELPIHTTEESNNERP